LSVWDIVYREFTMGGDNSTTSVNRRRALVRSAHVLVFAVVVSMARVGLAQQSGCTVPVNVLTPDFSSFSKADVDRALDGWKEFRGWERPTRGWDAPDIVAYGFGFLTVPFWNVERGLPVEAFLAREKNRPVSVESFGVDRGARRIAFVADNGRGVHPEARKFDAAVVVDILSMARAEDTFALLTVRGPRAELRLGSSREAMQAAADTLANPPQGSPNGESVLEGILEAASWFGPPQSGDSIIVISTEPESKHNANYTMVRRVVAAGAFRVFYIPLWESSPTVQPGWPNEGGDNSPRDIYALARASGGLELGGPWQGCRDKVEQLYSAIAEFYVLRVSSIGRDLNIFLSPAYQKRLRMAMLLYPWNLPACSTPTEAKSQTSGSPPPISTESSSHQRPLSHISYQ